MKIKLEHKGENYQADLAKPIDLSIPVGQVNCFYAPPLEASPYRSGGFIGSVKAGAPVNFFNVKFNPHGNGTHTECMGHISEKQYSVNKYLKQFHFFAKLISVVPEVKNGDQIITKKSIENIIPGNIEEALIIRTLPNTIKKTTRNYSGANPPYFDKNAIGYMVEKGVKHLIVDLPSIDREEDGGALAGHKTFWQYPDENRLDCTITELVYIPENIKDGIYWLNLQVAAFELDASPGRPVIYEMRRI
ncbi:MAG TPA: cyclase family protein [Bacteroidetes bacterium]|nr:cyclase family protein [Bacteroidota bacterium]